jgi:hypothetical protein
VEQWSSRVEEQSEEQRSSSTKWSRGAVEQRSGGAVEQRSSGIEAQRIKQWSKMSGGPVEY